MPCQDYSCVVYVLSSSGIHRLFHFKFFMSFYGGKWFKQRKMLLSRSGSWTSINEVKLKLHSDKKRCVCNLIYLCVRVCVCEHAMR